VQRPGPQATVPPRPRHSKRTSAKAGSNPTRRLPRADGPCQQGKWSSRMGLTLQFSLQPSPTRWSAVGPRRPSPLRARSIGAWRSLTDNDGRWQEDLTCGIGVASGVNGLPGRAFQARDRGATSGPHSTGGSRTTADTYGQPARSSARPFGHNRRLSKHPDSLSHGGSQGFKSPHLHPTTALVTGLADCSRRAAAVPGSLAGQQTGSNHERNGLGA
jgi:hypothetical protein